MENKDTHWLRPATAIEKFFWMLQEAGGFLVTVYGLTLRTTQPLSDKQVQEALVHLFRKVPTLRLCFRHREGVLWACDMNREQIDFKAEDTSDQLKVQEELMNLQFNNSEGPLWCARLLQQGSCRGSINPSLAVAFPHSRTLVLANHHGIADGTTNNRMVNIFLQILDDVIAGKPIDDTEQLGELASGEETKALLEAAEQELKEDENLLKQTLEELGKRQEVEKLIPRAFPNPDDPNYKTKIVTEELDEETTTRFFLRCKQEGVTVNSSFATLINGSLVDLVREAGLQMDTYSIYGLHDVNLRRYWQGDVSRALGCQLGSMEHDSSFTHQWRDNFWQHALEFHDNFQRSLENYKPLKYFVLSVLLMGDVQLQEAMKERPKPGNDFEFSNMGNLDLLILTKGEHVRLSHLVRTTQCWNERIQHMFHTFQGRLLYNLCYTNDYLSEQQAQRFVELVFRNLKDIL